MVLPGSQENPVARMGMGVMSSQEGCLVTSPALCGSEGPHRPCLHSRGGDSQVWDSQGSRWVCPSQAVSRKLSGMASLVASQLLGQVAFETSATVREGGRRSVDLTRMFFSHRVSSRQRSLACLPSHLLLILPTWVRVGICSFLWGSLARPAESVALG